MAISVWAGISEFPLPSPRGVPDGYVIQTLDNQYIVSPGGGGATIGGSIAATQVAVGSGANTIAGTNNFIYSNGSLQLFLSAGQARAIDINSAIGVAAPVINIRSNGSQVSYISDLGNGFAQHFSFADGISSDAIAAYGTSTISFQNNLAAQTDAGQDVGTPTNRFNNGYIVNLFTTAINDFSATNMINFGSGLIYLSQKVVFADKIQSSIYPDVGAGSFQVGGPGQAWGSMYADYFYGDASNLTNIPAPGIGPVLDASNDIGGRTLYNSGHHYVVSDNTYDNGQIGGNRWANVATENVSFHSALNSSGSSQFYFDSPGMMLQVNPVPASDNSLTCGLNTNRFANAYFVNLNDDAGNLVMSMNSSSRYLYNQNSQLEIDFHYGYQYAPAVMSGPSLQWHDFLLNANNSGSAVTAMDWNNPSYLNIISGAGASAPTPQGLIALPLSAFGAGTINQVLGTPDAWHLVQSNGTQYKIPLYLP